MSATGRPDLAAVLAYNIPAQPPGAILLNSNESPWPPSPAVQAALLGAAAHGNRYPDWVSADLVARLARLLELDRSWITAGCGSVSLCQQLVQACCGPGEEVLCAWRSFDAYPAMARVHGAVPRTVPLTAGHGHDLEAMAAAVSDRTRLVFVCNPNNPTGTAVGTAELAWFLDRVPDDVVVVLDEAYREFVTDPAVPDGIPLALRRRNVAVLRTFSKAYGMAGIRVGYCVAPPALTDVVAKVAIPFTVSRLAQVAAVAALDEAADVPARLAPLIAERDRVRAALLAAGHQVPPSHANFLWLPLGAASAAFGEHCATRSVIVRVFPGEGVRVTVGLPAENTAFLAAAATFPVPLAAQTA